MIHKHHSYVQLSRPAMVEGWGVYEVDVDGNFKLYMCQTHEFFDAGRRYDFDLFVDIAAEFPAYFFADKPKAFEFCKVKTNRYPIYRQLQLLKHQPNYWFSTYINSYLEMLQKSKEKHYDFEM